MKKTLVIIALMTAAYAKAQTEAHRNGDLSGDGMTQERLIAAEAGQICSLPEKSTSQSLLSATSVPS